MKTTQMTPFFSSAFSTLSICNIYFWVWNYIKLIFKFITLVYSGLQTTSIFCQKLLIWTAHNTFELSKSAQKYSFNNQVQTFIPHSACFSNVCERQSLLHNTLRESRSRWFPNCIWLHARLRFADLRFERKILLWVIV